MKPKGSKYHCSRSLVGVWAPKVYTILLLGPFGKAALPAHSSDVVPTERNPKLLKFLEGRCFQGAGTPYNTLKTLKH